MEVEKTQDISFTEFGISEEEWPPFIQGRMMTIAVLTKLLQYKYRAQKNVQINTSAITLSDTASYEDLVSDYLNDAAPDILYELIPVLRSYEGERSVVTLAVRRPGSSLLVFTLPGESAYLPDEDIRDVDYVFNNRRGVTDQANGYFIFDFLESLFAGKIGASRISQLYAESNRAVSTRDMAVRIIRELTLFTTMKRNLVRLYGELNALLIGLQNEPSNARLRRKVEYTKQQFFQWTECGLTNCVMTVVEEEETRQDKESSCFFSVPLETSSQDLIRIRANNLDDTDSLLKELVGYMRFLIDVVGTSDISQSNKVTIRAQLNVVDDDDMRGYFNRSDIEGHIRRLRYLILSRIDRANLPVIDAQSARQLGFTQSDYNTLIKDSVIPYNILSRYLDDALQPATLLLGSSRTREVLDGSGEKMDLSNVRLIFWVLENESYTSLLLLHQQQKLKPWQRGIYAPSLKTTDTSETVSLAKQLTRRSGITAYRTEFVSHVSSRERIERETSLYTLFIIKSISERLDRESADLDWVGEMKGIINSVTPTIMIELMETLLYSLHRYILEFSLAQLGEQRESCIMTLPIFEPANIPNQVVILSSSISDLAKLSMTGEFIDDNPIADMLRIMPKKANCHVYDVTYWGNMMRKDRDENNMSFSLPKSKAFQRQGVRMIIIPVNQDNIKNNDHWSVGIIQPAKKNVYYYSSVGKDPYFRDFFKPFMKRYLEVQTPGEKYTYQRLKGETQPFGCVNCALYMLDKISEVCAPLTQRITYTREELNASISARLISLIVRSEGDLTPLIMDAHVRFVTLPKEWKHISDNLRLLADYRKAYLDLLAQMLRATMLYTNASIDTLIQSLGKLGLTATSQEIAAIFKRTLAANERETKASPRIVLTETKRKRLPVLMYEGGDPEEKGRKSRLCLVYNAEIQEKINRLVDQLLYLHRHQPEGESSLSAGKSDFVYEHLILPLVPQALPSFAMLDDLVDELFVRSSTELRDRLLEVVEKYVKPEECAKKMIKCLYCGILTTDLSCCKK